jgi:hypothetical protein
VDVYEIPLKPAPERFGVSLPGLSLTFRITWRNRGGAGWVLDLETEDGVPLVSGLPLVTGTDLLAQHKHLGIPGGLFVVSSGAHADDEPTFTGLGTDQRLYYATGL